MHEGFLWQHFSSLDEICPMKCLILHDYFHTNSLSQYQVLMNKEIKSTVNVTSALTNNDDCPSPTLAITLYRPARIATKQNVLTQWTSALRLRKIVWCRKIILIQDVLAQRIKLDTTVVENMTSHEGTVHIPLDTYQNWHIMCRNSHSGIAKNSSWWVAWFLSKTLFFLILS